jgi:short-subunit dehydrogenase
MPDHRLANATALVTGAGSGIGRAVSVALARLGTKVALVGRRREPLEETRDTIEKEGGHAATHACDLTDDRALEALVGRVLAESGQRLGVLVNNAAHYVMSSFEETSTDDLDAIFRVNVRAPFVLTKVCLPALRAAKGDVVFVNSSAALGTGVNVSAYAASKAALKSLADGLRNEVNKDGVRVLSVYAGRTATPMQRAVFAREGREYRPEMLLQPEDVASGIASALSLPATAELTDLQIRPAKKS